MNIREIAVKVLDEVLNNKAFSNIVLDKALGDEKISQVDKNFITMLVHGVLQNYYLLDYKIKKLNSKKIKRKDIKFQCKRFRSVRSFFTFYK